jgi:hypothetical protein
VRPAHEPVAGTPGGSGSNVALEVVTQHVHRHARERGEPLFDVGGLLRLDHGASKATAADGTLRRSTAREIRREGAAGTSYGTVAKRFDISRFSVAEPALGKTWRHVTSERFETAAARGPEISVADAE